MGNTNILKISLEISTKKIRSTLESANSCYWASDMEWESNTGLGFTIIEHGDPDRKKRKHVISDAKARKQLARMAQSWTSCPINKRDNAEYQFARFVDEDENDFTGDALLQWIVFGKIRYC